MSSHAITDLLISSNFLQYNSIQINSWIFTFNKYFCHCLSEHKIKILFFSTWNLANMKTSSLTSNTVQTDISNKQYIFFTFFLSYLLNYVSRIKNISVIKTGWNCLKWLKVMASKTAENIPRAKYSFIFTKYKIIFEAHPLGLCFKVVGKNHMLFHVRSCHEI